MPKKLNPGKLFVHEFRERLRPHLEAHYDDMREILENQKISLEAFIDLCAKPGRNTKRCRLRGMSESLANEAGRPPVVIEIDNYRATIYNLPSALAFCYKYANRAA